MLIIFWLPSVFTTSIAVYPLTYDVNFSSTYYPTKINSLAKLDDMQIFKKSPEGVDLKHKW